MVVWQLSAPSSGAPFKGRNLYALLMFGMLHVLLCSLTWRALGSHYPSWVEHFNFNPLCDLADMDPSCLEQFLAHNLLHGVRKCMVLFVQSHHLPHEYSRLGSLCGVLEGGVTLLSGG